MNVLRLRFDGRKEGKDPRRRRTPSCMVDVLPDLSFSTTPNRKSLCVRIIDAADAKGVAPSGLAGAWTRQDRRLWLVEDLVQALLHWIDHEIDMVSDTGAALSCKMGSSISLLKQRAVSLNPSGPTFPQPVVAPLVLQHHSYLQILELVALEVESASFGTHCWSRQIHRLLKEARRQRAAELLWIGYEIAYRRAPGLGEVWVEHVMPLAMPFVIGTA